MELSREYVLRELVAIKAIIAEWESELAEPRRLDEHGAEVPLFPDGVPPNIPVAQLGLPIGQLRAELLGCAGRLEALTTSG